MKTFELIDEKLDSSINALVYVDLETLSCFKQVLPDRNRKNTSTSDCTCEVEEAMCA